MEQVRATAMATDIAAQHGITRQAAFDMILATASELEISGTRYTPKQAGEIEALISHGTKAGCEIKLNRPVIGGVK